MTTLTVQSLINALTAYPPDLPVWLETSDGNSHVQVEGIGFVERREQDRAEPAGIYIGENGLDSQLYDQT